MDWRRGLGHGNGPYFAYFFIVDIAPPDLQIGNGYKIIIFQGGEIIPGE
jgi:hypothetical protein